MIPSVWKEYLKELDWFLVLPSFLLAGLGLVSIYSSSYFQMDFTNFQKQLVFLGLGGLALVFFSLLDWRIFRDGPYLVIVLYLVCLVGLLGLLFFAPNIRGSRSWYRLGPVSFDPIEFIKLVLVILLAKYFSTRHAELYRIRHILVSGAYVFLLCLLILLQPEVGSVLVLVLLWIGILVVSGIKLRHFFLLCLAALFVFSLSWFFLLQNYHKARIASFLSPSLSPLGIGWNQAQAKIAIGSGGFWGKGIGNGTQIRYGFLPASQTDFVFAGLAEETGLIGAGLVLFCFGLLVVRLTQISLNSRSNFPRLFSMGLNIILVSQVFINLGMNLGLLPIIGIPLPLVSYGGSSLLATFIALGIMQSIKRHT